MARLNKRFICLSDIRKRRSSSCVSCLYLFLFLICIHSSPSVFELLSSSSSSSSPFTSAITPASKKMCFLNSKRSSTAEEERKENRLFKVAECYEEKRRKRKRLGRKERKSEDIFFLETRNMHMVLRSSAVVVVLLSNSSYPLEWTLPPLLLLVGPATYSPLGESAVLKECHQPRFSLYLLLILLSCSWDRNLKWSRRKKTKKESRDLACKEEGEKK